jgi:hypothetical protein
VTAIALRPREVVLLPFPFSDLSERKLRPALVMAAANQSHRLSLGKAVARASILLSRSTISEIQKVLS